MISEPMISKELKRKQRYTYAVKAAACMSVYFVTQDFLSSKENKKPLATTSAPTKKQRDKQRQKAKNATALEQAKTKFPLL